MTTISNQELCVTISPLGAELQSVKDAQSGREYLWQGDARWWSGRSPLLFPIVGGMWNSKCRIDGKEVTIPKHGIMRQRLWKVADVQTDSVRFEYVSTVGDFETFPFAFRLFITYRLEGRKVVAEFEVENTGGCDLWFQFGGHPAIAIPEWKEENEVDGYLQFTGQPDHILRAREQGCTQPEHFPVPSDGEGFAPLCVETFANEALIFEENQVSAITVLDLNKKPVATVASGSPAWLVWSPQGIHSPFVCCEPWYGLPDKEQFDGPVEERPYINRLPSNEKWSGWFSIELF